MRSPITSERQNIQILRESGLPDRQAEAIAAVVENAIQSGFEKFAEVLSRELGAIRTELKAEIAGVRSELKTEIAAVRSELKIEIRDSRIDIQKSINDQVWKIVGAVTAIVSIAVAIIKLFPNVPG
jgi:hypothetical protein